MPATATAAALPTALPPGLDLTLTSIHMITADIGWATGHVPTSAQRVLRTTDGGETWADLTPPDPVWDDPHDAGPYGSFWKTVRASDELTAIVAHSSSGNFWRTEDGGHSWIASPAPMGAPTYSSFPSATSGWALTLLGHLTGGREAATLLRTRDAGATWEEILSPIEGANHLQDCMKTGLSFADDEAGWITLACQEWSWYPGDLGEPWIEVTADGGATWARLPVPPPPGNPNLFTPQDDLNIHCDMSSPRLFSPLSGAFALSCTVQDLSGTHQRPVNYLYRTFDGAATWTTYEMPGSHLEVIDQVRLWSIRDDEPLTDTSSSPLQRIYRSEDGGATWSLVNTTNWIGQFSFVDGRHVFAIAFSPTMDEQELTALVTSSDGGSSWQILRPVTTTPRSN